MARRIYIEDTEYFIREGQKFGGRLVAKGRGIREIDRLVRDHGGTKSGWRKMSQEMLIESGRTGEILSKEIHWYEHHGVGRVEFKIKVPE